MPDTITPDVIDILRAARRIAIVGLSPKPHRPSHSVGRYLQAAGYEIVPIHPSGTPVLGATTWATLEEAVAATGPVDVVDVFRRADALPEMVPGILAVRPRLAWFQLGLRHDEAARELEAAGIPVVQDHCLAVEHERFLGE